MHGGACMFLPISPQSSSHQVPPRPPRERGVKTEGMEKYQKEKSKFITWYKHPGVEMGASSAGRLSQLEAQ